MRHPLRKRQLMPSETSSQNEATHVAWDILSEDILSERGNWCLFRHPLRRHPLRTRQLRHPLRMRQLTMVRYACREKKESERDGRGGWKFVGKFSHPPLPLCFQAYLAYSNQFNHVKCLVAHTARRCKKKRAPISIWRKSNVNISIWRKSNVNQTCANSIK